MARFVAIWTRQYIREDDLRASDRVCMTDDRMTKLVNDVAASARTEGERAGRLAGGRSSVAQVRSLLTAVREGNSDKGAFGAGYEAACADLSRQIALRFGPQDAGEKP